MELVEIEAKFKEILESREYQEQKNIKLSSLMSYLERFYDIQILENHTTEEQKQSKEFKLYLEIARARK
jgi:hypothetical protein